MKRINKTLAIIFGLLLCVQYELNNLSFAQKGKTDEKDKKDKKESPQDIRWKIFYDPDWLKITAFWKKMNRLKLTKEYQKNYEMFKPVMEEYKNLSNYLNALEDKKIIYNYEKDVFKQIIDDRFYFLSYKFGAVKCYQASALGNEIEIKREDLEKQFDILEKLYAEDKITTEAFKTAKKNITEDVKVIYKMEGKPNAKDLQSIYIDYLQFLNK